MSIFDDQFAAVSAPALAHAMADTAAVEYTPKIGSSETFAAILGPLDTDRTRGAAGELEINRTRSLLVQESVKPRSELQTNGTITIGSRTYAITHIGDEQDGLYEIRIEETRKGEMVRSKAYRR